MRAAATADAEAEAVTYQTALSAEQLAKWAECSTQLQALGFSEDQAESTLKRAFGWSSQAYW